MMTANYNFQHNVLKQHIKNISNSELKEIIRTKNEKRAKEIFFKALLEAHLDVFYNSYNFKCEFIFKNENYVLVYYFDDRVNDQVISECYATIIVANKINDYFTLEYSFDDLLVLGQFMEGNHYNYGFFTEENLPITKAINISLQNNKEDFFNFTQDDFLCDSNDKNKDVAKDFLGNVIKTYSNKKDVAKKKSDMTIIKGLQTTMLILFITTLLFVFIYSMLMIKKHDRILDSLEAKTYTKLVSLNANQKVYCIEDGLYYLIYIKNSQGNIELYQLVRATTSLQIKEYFGENVKLGRPPIHYTVHEELVTLIVGTIIFVCSIIVLIVILRQKVKEKIFKLEKTNNLFKKNKARFTNDEISSYEYKKVKKDLFSKKILNNNKFFEIFKLFY